MENPRNVSPGSIMPNYDWLLKQNLDNSTLESKINVMRTLGVPYAPGYEKQALQDLTKQAEELATDLQKNGAPAESNKEIIALIAYLQRMGTDIKGDTTTVK